jgi:hypothetical protein
MKSKLIGFLITLTIALSAASDSFGRVEWDLQETLKMDQPPLDVAVSLDGRYVFVLTSGGVILIYTQDGKLEDKFEVGNDIDQIHIGPRGEQLFLTSRKDKTVRIASLNFIVDINVSGSPYKGPEDAPVVLAVFSEFQ